MKGSFVSLLLLLMLSNAFSPGLAQEAPTPMVHKCLHTFDLPECSKLQCVKTCVNNGIPWENGACLDEYKCCCHLAMK